jgi:aminoglycoside 3-N-acetyltransferase
MVDYISNLKKMNTIKKYILLLKAFLKKKVSYKIIVQIKNILLFGLIKKLKNYKKNLKIRSKKTITYDDLIITLKGLGVREGMKIMVHSSLSGIGYVEGGAKTVIKALVDLIGFDGLILMPAPPVTAINVDKNSNFDVFDPKETKCSTGIICETFRKMPGVYRSIHPTHSVIAYGREAEWIISGHNLDRTPFGPNSPFARLLKLNGSILGLGLDVRWITFYHHFEDICEFFPIKVYSDKIYKLPILNYDKRIEYIETYIHNPDISIFRLNNDAETLKKINQALDKHSDIIRNNFFINDSYLVSTSSIIFTLDFILKQDLQTIYNNDLIKLINN